MRARAMLAHWARVVLLGVHLGICSWYLLAYVILNCPW